MMTDSNGYPFTLGADVMYLDGHVLRRSIIPNLNNRRDVVRWVISAVDEQHAEDGAVRRGVVVGVRHLSDGILRWGGYDEQSEYRRTSTFPAVLIAWDLRRKPVLVRRENVTLVNPPALEVTR